MEQHYTSADSRKRAPDGDVVNAAAGVDIGGPSPKKTRVDPQVTEERHFYSLYMEVLDYVQLKTGISDEMVSSGVGCIIDSFRYDCGRQFSDVDLTQPDVICGYLFRYAAHGAGLARCRVLDAVRNCEALKEICLRKQKQLRVVSLGGGPGNDAVGFCSALHELGFCTDRGQLALIVTVVDAVRQWSECVDRVNRLLRERDFGNVSDMFQRNQVRLSFNRTQLPGNPKHLRVCYEALGNADVILVTRLFSALEWKIKRDLIEDLHSTLTDESLILLIDSPFHPDLWNRFDVLYVSEADQYYGMSEVHTRFGSYDSVQSKARIAVLRKHLDISDSQSDTD